MVIGGSLVVGCDGRIQWWVGRWVAATVGRCVGCDGGGFCCAKSVVGGPACEWVPKYGLSVGGLAVIMGGCVGCGGSVGGGGCCCCWFFFFFLRCC